MASKALERPSMAREWLLRYNVDYALLATVAALVVFGIVMVYSASYVVAYEAWGDPHYFFVRQVLWAGLGAGIMLVVGRVPYQWWGRLAVPGLLMAVLLLLAVQFTPLGVDFGGARRWLRLGPLPPLQPSDFVKLTLVLFMSVYLSRQWDRIRDLRHGLIPFVLIVGGVAALVVGERDLGTTIIILVTTTAVFFAAGADLLQLGAIGLAGGGFALTMAIVEPYRWQRIVTFFAPLQDVQGAGYQMAHILMALGSGGLTGQGLGASREKYFYLPNAHSDSIFAVIGEELGLIGCLVVIALFGILAYRGYQVALRAPDRLGFLLATGVTTWIVFQAFVNVAGTTNSLPLTGVPLPFISSGGSSMIASLFGIGLLLNISRYRADVADADLAPSSPRGRRTR